MVKWSKVRVQWLTRWFESHSSRFLRSHESLSPSTQTGYGYISLLHHHNGGELYRCQIFNSKKSSEDLGDICVYNFVKPGARPLIEANYADRADLGAILF